MTIGQRLHRAAHEIREIPVDVPELAAGGGVVVSPRSVGRALVAVAPVVVLAAVVATLLTSVGVPPAFDEAATESTTPAAAPIAASDSIDGDASPSAADDEPSPTAGASGSAPLAADATAVDSVAAVSAAGALTPREEVALVTAAVERAPGTSERTSEASVPDSLPLRGEFGLR